MCAKGTFDNLLLQRFEWILKINLEHFTFVFLRKCKLKENKIKEHSSVLKNWRYVQKTRHFNCKVKITVKHHLTTHQRELLLMAYQIL